MKRVGAIGLAVVGATVVLVALVCRSSDSPSRRNGKQPSSARTTRSEPDPQTLPRASFSGVVTSEGGKPIAGANVCAVRDGMQFSDTGSACASTDTQGRYKVDALIAGEYQISANAERHVPVTWQGPPPGHARYLTLAPGEQRSKIDLVLAPGGVEVHGTVTDIGGGAIAEAWVWVANYAANRNRINVSITRSRANGSFTVWLAPGPVAAGAEADGYLDDYTESLAPTRSLHLRLTPESSLSGTVVDAKSGAPVVGARVANGVEVDGDGAGTATDEAVTDANGRFRLAKLGAGRYKPTAEAVGLYGVVRESVLVGLGQDVDGVVIPVHPASVVRGRVRVRESDGKVRECREPSLSLDGTGSFIATGADDGSVQVDAVFPGTYRVSVACEGYVPADKVPELTVGDADITGLEWTLEAGGTLVASVRTKAGAPIRGASISGQGLRYSDSVSAPDGTITFRGVPPGEIEVTATARDYAPTQPPLKATVIAGRATRLDIVLENPGGTIAGTIVDDTGAPVSGARVIVFPWSTPSDFTPDALSREDGSFQVGGLPPGSYRVYPSRTWIGNLRRPGTTDDDDQDQTVEIAGRETVTLRLVVENESAWIAGTVVDATGAPVSDAYVTAWRETDGVKRRGQLREKVHDTVVTDPSGSFRVTGLSHGAYTINAERRGGARGVIEHVALMSRSNRIVIKPTGFIAGTVGTRAGPPADDFTIDVRDAKRFRRVERFFRTAGAFTLADLPAGKLTLRAAARAGNVETTITLAEGERKTGVALLLVPRLRVTGRLVALDDRAPAADMSVAVDGVDGSGYATTTADGRFAVENIAAGTIHIGIHAIHHEASPFHSALIQRTVASEGSADLGDIAIPRRRPGTLNGDLGFYLSNADPAKPRVVDVREDGPAFKAGLAAGDIVLSIDGHDVTGDGAYLQFPLLQIPAGTKVTLGLARRSISITAVAP